MTSVKHHVLDNKCNRAFNEAVHLIYMYKYK